MSKSNLANSLTKLLNMRLVIITSRGVQLLSKIKNKSDGDPIYVIGDPMK